jgi:hypothetical protein
MSHLILTYKSRYLPIIKIQEMKETWLVYCCKIILPDFHAQSTFTGISGHVTTTDSLKVPGAYW